MVTDTASNMVKAFKLPSYKHEKEEDEDEEDDTDEESIDSGFASEIFDSHFDYFLQNTMGVLPIYFN